MEERKIRYLNDPEKGLIRRACDAMSVLSIPDDLSGETYYPERKEFSEMAGITCQEILDVDIYPMFLEGPEKEIGHNARVAIMGTCISKLLEFNRDARVANFLLGVAHDKGKLALREHYPERNHYDVNTRRHNEQLEKFKKGHVAVENIPMYWGSIIASAIEQSHTHQSGGYLNNPYPRKLALRKTKASFFLSQQLAITDFLDSITSRPCKFTGKYFSPDEIISMAVKEYGNMHLVYNGNLFHKTDISGKELIQELQRTNFAGRQNPTSGLEANFRMDPFNGLEIK